MSVDIISENCYTCRNCLITRQFCRLKNKLIQNIYRDKCDKYVQREIEKCELCGAYVVELPQHVSSFHMKTWSEYKILCKHKKSDKTSIRSNALWD